MRSRSTAISVFLVGLSILALAQDRIGSAQTTQVAAARELLTRMSSTSAWSGAALPADAIVTGTVTRHMGDDSSSSTFTMKVRGQKQYRYEENGASLVASGPVASVVTSDGKVRSLPPHAALGSRGLILPMSTILADWNASDVEIAYVGETSINGDPCVGIQLKRRPADDDKLGRAKSLASTVVVWISTNSALLIRADYSRLALDNHNAAIKESTVYSDYRLVNGVAVPFHQERYLYENHIKTIQFSSVRFNTGLGDPDFLVPAVRGGGK